MSAPDTTAHEEQAGATNAGDGMAAEIMIVDDSPQNIALLSDILRDDYRLAVAISGDKALQMIEAGRLPDLILLDVMLPYMDGFEVKRRLARMPRAAAVPVMFISGKSSPDDLRAGFELGAADYVTKPFDPRLLKTRIRNLIAAKRQRDAAEARILAAEAELASLRMGLQQARELIVRALASLAGQHDALAGSHIECSRHLVSSLAAELKRSSPRHGNLPDSYLRGIALCAALHDAGMLAVPPAIRNKPGVLDAAEWELVRMHPAKGWEAIAKACSDGGVEADLVEIARNVCLYHHERWDGGGYPEGLAGTQIPFAARLVAVVDAYDAMTSERSWRPALTHAQAVELIMSLSGAAYDPDICTAFQAVSADLQKIAQEHRLQAPMHAQANAPT